MELEGHVRVFVVIEAQADGSKEPLAGVFISHSRKDKDFVGHLKEALEKRGYDVRVDVEDILPTEDWLAGVFSGIEEADAFIFVISPDSVESEDCQRELDHCESIPRGVLRGARIQCMVHL